MSLQHRIRAVIEAHGIDFADAKNIAFDILEDLKASGHVANSADQAAQSKAMETKTRT